MPPGCARDSKAVMAVCAEDEGGLRGLHGVGLVIHVTRKEHQTYSPLPIRCQTVHTFCQVLLAYICTYIRLFIYLQNNPNTKRPRQCSVVMILYEILNRPLLFFQRPFLLHASPPVTLTDQGCTIPCNDMPCNLYYMPSTLWISLLSKKKYFLVD